MFLYHQSSFLSLLGSVVRTAPNELSFNNVQSWKDIYGFRPGHKTFIKSAFYDGGSFADQVHSIVSERDPVEHGKMRKHLSHAFSDRSLLEQEDLIAGVVDTFIAQIGKKGVEGLNISEAFGMMTFDIIGSLAFGETFGVVESGKFVAWQNPKAGDHSHLKSARCIAPLDFDSSQRSRTRSSRGYLWKISFVSIDDHDFDATQD